MEQEQPVDPELVKTMNGIGHLLDNAFNQQTPKAERKWAFALFVFPFGSGEDHRSNYVSNANREDMLATMKEFIARAEGTFVEPTSSAEN